MHTGNFGPAAAARNAGADLEALRNRHHPCPARGTCHRILRLAISYLARASLPVQT